MLSHSDAKSKKADGEKKVGRLAHFFIAGPLSNGPYFDGRYSEVARKFKA